MVSDIEIIIRIVIVIILCGLIGLERERWHKPAGLRTNILVGLGSTVITIVALNILVGFNPSGTVDIGRIIGQIVTGIGFLGAGAIIQGRGSIHGLTTAATIWVVATIGIAIGLGYYYTALMATLATLIVLFILGRIEKKQEIKEKDTNEQSS